MATTFGIPKTDLTGMKFGRLTVLRLSKERFLDQVSWDCLCDCGKTTIATTTHLRKGFKKSCGCYHDEAASERAKTHGESKSRLYKTHQALKNRCLNKNCKAYKNYGLRGITVCDEWLGENGYLNFREWAYKNGYKSELTIDRIDNNKGYSPENCRWATIKEQENNKRTCHYVTINGITKNLTEWSEIYGIKRDTVKCRLKNGWNVIDALTLPINPKRRYKKWLQKQN